ncbi:MAG: type II toxin-antitoxin system HicA family toxin [Dehalococcoidia bacterium]|nr:type II toxin-antitoxin system HicA family toxin [Dehalococcoidia bacterium]
MRPSKIIRALERDGWYEVRSKGGHRQFKHPTKEGRVTLPVHGSHEVEPWLLDRIIKAAGLTAEEFKRLL